MHANEGRRLSGVRKSFPCRSRWVPAIQTAHRRRRSQNPPTWLAAALADRLTSFSLTRRCAINCSIVMISSECFRAAQEVHHGLPCPPNHPRSPSARRLASALPCAGDRPQPPYVPLFAIRPLPWLAKDRRGPAARSRLGVVFGDARRRIVSARSAAVIPVLLPW